jgi:hypothetical protein
MTSARQEQQLDALDEAVLGQLRTAWRLMDPPPDDLDARVAFTIDLTDLDIDVALLEEMPVGSGVRLAKETRTFIVDCRALTVMVSITEKDGGVRLDGWHTPAGRLRVQLRTAPPGPDGRRGSYAVETDGSSRFAFPAVPHGLAQLVLHSAVHAGRSIVTPSIRL